jgi:magnesium-transporting ATPase (P-type)
MAILEPTNLLLLACALIYGLIGEAQEAWILLGFVVAICLLDGWQQQRSRRALAELARLSSPRARVRRDGIDMDLALALAVLPNEIPVVVALFLALGALRLGRIGLLARWPAAVESLGSATVLAVDKTGTLTENRMAVQQLLTWPAGELWHAGEPLDEPWHQLLELAMLASRHDPVDAMEQAIERLAQAELQQSEHLHPDWPLLREYPLSADLLVFSQLWCAEGGRWPGRPGPAGAGGGHGPGWGAPPPPPAGGHSGREPTAGGARLPVRADRPCGAG